MIYSMYSIQDTMVGFGQPNIIKNDEIAKRDYHNFLKQTPNAEYMRLYKVGTFDDETGTVLPIIPECIEGGITNGEVQNAD